MNVPTIATNQSAGADITSIEDITVPAKGSATVSTGYYYDLNTPAFVKGRSGLAFKSNIVAFEGTIDSDYKGEVKVLLFNHSDKDFHIIEGDAIAQLVVMPVITSSFFPSKDVERVGGFGSTDIDVAIIDPIDEVLF